ncbi:hypothetical protein LJR219_004137 [Phenylobacterium sp. LjRoot219]|uniref:hypothetical protein n=1 Tax=Phenylobacterium sp. LjRoot219 TaxID=3342283 RepID=UPI003ED05525
MMHSAPTLTDFVHGDATGLLIPAHGGALEAEGAAFLTRAFQAFGALEPDNCVARIARFEICPGGSTGQKFFLSVEYEKPEPHLHRELFVKFSRDFSDTLRDHGRHEMESEARFAAVSRLPGFPISTPAAYFADYRQACGTGLLITERIAFGEGHIEPHRRKFLDYQLADPLPYYRAVVKALARLAGAHKAGELSPDIAARFPFDAEAAAASDKIRYDERQLRDLVAKYAEFAQRYPQLLPANIRTPEFVAKLDREVGPFLQHEATIKRALQSQGDFIALCHWNANIDNAWFWRDPAGELQCGLMDWGRVRQLNVAFALWGCLSGASVEIWDRHFDDLLALFVDEFNAHGGPRLDAAELKLHLQLYVATMGLAWLMEAPARILYRLPEAATASGPQDPVFLKNDSARGQLNVLTAFLNLWQTHDFGASLEQLLQRT